MTKIAYKQEQWDLSDLFTGFDSPEMKGAMKLLETKVKQFEEFRSDLNPELESAPFVNMLQSYEGIIRILSRLMGFSSLSFSTDTQDQQAQTHLARFRQLAADANNRTLFFKLWWKALPDAAADRLLKDSGDYRYWLEALRLERPYTLSEAEESIINLKDVNGPAALLTIFTTITGRYQFNMEVNGTSMELTYDELAAYYRHPSPKVRAAAYQELFRVYGQDKPILGQIYQYLLRDWYSENIGLRKFASPISVRNLYNDIPDAVVDVLLDVCRTNAPLFQRYFQLKARWLGMEKLRRYDIYATVASAEKRVEFNDAVELVLDSFRRFDPRVAELAERVLAEHHLDSEVRKGKRGGAFCSSISPDLTPWVLQSYQGRPYDVATMAHELGHAVHSMLASDHSAVTHHASLPLAETASTFGEMLVIDRLLSEDPDRETRRDLLFREMDNNYATIMRQAFFAIFEREAHQMVQEGAAVDDLSAAYAQNLVDQFGDALEIGDEFQLEWILIPHIYRTPFYVYAYAFGQLLVLSLYQQYLAEGQAFKPLYLELLSAGGSDSPERLLSRAGIDMSSADFWQGGFAVLKNSLETLEAIEVPGA